MSLLLYIIKCEIIMIDYLLNLNIPYLHIRNNYSKVIKSRKSK